MQTGDIVFSAIIPVLDTSKLVIEFLKKPNKTKHQTMSEYFSPSEKNKTCQGLSRSISSQDFGNYAWWDFILGKQSLLWWHKQALSSQSKLGIFPACTCLYVAGISKWSELLGWLTGTTRLSCCCQPRTELFSCLCTWALPFPSCYKQWGSWLERNAESPNDIAKSPKGIAQSREAC